MLWDKYGIVTEETANLALKWLELKLLLIVGFQQISKFSVKHLFSWPRVDQASSRPFADESTPPPLSPPHFIKNGESGRMKEALGP